MSGILSMYVFLTLSCFVTFSLVMFNQLSVLCMSMCEKTLRNVSVTYTTVVFHNSHSYVSFVH